MKQTGWPQNFDALLLGMFSVEYLWNGLGDFRVFALFLENQRERAFTQFKPFGNVPTFDRDTVFKENMSFMALSAQSVSSYIQAGI